MKYFNASFEICAMFFLLVLMIYYYGKNRRYNLSNRIYALFLPLALVNIVSDILSIYSIYYYHLCPAWFVAMINMVYFITQILAPTMFCIYVMSLVSPSKERVELLVSYYMIPALFFIVIVLLNPVTKWIFYFDENGLYQYGALHCIVYINAVGYLIMGLVFLLKYLDSINYTQRISLCAIAAVVVVCICVQYCYKEYLLTGVGLVLGLLMLYLTYQNPDINMDQLTGVSNRNAFINEIRDLLDRKSKFQVILVALDNFKAVNDVFGIRTGDLILRHLAVSMGNITPSYNIYRYSGDIMAVLECSSIEADKRMNQLCNLFTAPWNINKMEMQISASVCMVQSQNHEHDEKSIISAIDYSVAEAKKMGHCSIYTESDEVLKKIARERKIEQALMEHINQCQFEVFYQPIYNVKTKRFTTAEALARLYVPEIGDISPDEFIRVAEQKGYIVEVGLLVLEEVCKLIKEESLLEKGIEYIEVNLSVAQCIQEQFYNHVLTLLNKYRIPSRMINFEITETAAAYSERMLVRNMASLSIEGITFSLDDYGTGYSTMSYISKLPFSLIKIDKEIIQTAMVDRRTEVILLSTKDMFKRLDLKVVAEGVESQEQAECLIDMEIDYLQGYYYSKPLSKADYIEFLNKM